MLLGLALSLHHLRRIHSHQVRQIVRQVQVCIGVVRLHGGLTRGLLRGLLGMAGQVLDRR